MSNAGCSAAGQQQERSRDIKIQTLEKAVFFIVPGRGV
jgi:hypothetical protein